MHGYHLSRITFISVLFGDIVLFWVNIGSNAGRLGNLGVKGVTNIFCRSVKLLILVNLYQRSMTYCYTSLIKLLTEVVRLLLNMLHSLLQTMSTPFHELPSAISQCPTFKTAPLSTDEASFTQQKAGTFARQVVSPPPPFFLGLA